MELIYTFPAGKKERVVDSLLGNKKDKRGSYPPVCRFNLAEPMTVQ